MIPSNFSKMRQLDQFSSPIKAEVWGKKSIKYFIECMKTLMLCLKSL